MKNILLLAALTLSGTVCTAAEYHLTLDPDCTRVNWTLGDVLHTVHGTFKLRRAAVTFDTDSGRAGGEILVDATSGESGSNARDGRMHQHVLESARYPDASFVPDHVEGKLALAGESNIKLHGSFTIHGASHELTVPVGVTAKGDKLDVHATFDVPFVAWGMKDPSTLFLKVNKLVQVEILSKGTMSASNLHH